MMADKSILKLPKVALDDSPHTYNITNNNDEGLNTRKHSFSQKDNASVNKSDILMVDTYSVSDTNLKRSTEIEGHPLTQEINTCPKATNISEQQNLSRVINKENYLSSSLADSADVTGSQGDMSLSKPDNMELSDAEIVKRAQMEGRVDVVLPGTVTQEGCCRFVSEILKCILYQRQQLPMTYDQLVHSQKKEQASIQNKEMVSWRPAHLAEFDRRKCQRTLQELEEVFQKLEELFSLSLVPRVLLLLGGSLVLPKELYEINMEALVFAAGDRSLRVSTCLRQLFRTLFVADLLSDARPVRLMATTVLVLAHRDCGVGWFRPKLDFKMPTRIKHQIIALSSEAGISGTSQLEVSERVDYVWFQAPVTIKGFSK